jgi:hypothetical protein
MERDHVLSEMRAEAEETAVALKITTGTDCLLCEVRAEAEERVVALK